MKEKKVSNYCSSCNGVRNHIVLYETIVDTSNEDYHCQWVYSIVECLGCDNVSFRSVFEDLESLHYDNDENYQTVYNYPVTINGHSKIRRAWDLPQQVATVYHESLDAFANGCHLLTGVGFRAIIEAVCIDKGIKGSLKVKINKLLSNKLITKKEAERMHAVRFLGNEAVHEMTLPKKESLFAVLGIVEHLLNNLYIIDSELEKISELKQIISDFHGFSNLLTTKLRKQKIGEEFTIQELLGMDFERVEESIIIFENELISKINKAEIEYLSIGKIEAPQGKKQKQFFVKSK
jgi:hypothetical protein